MVVRVQCAVELLGSVVLVRISGELTPETGLKVHGALLSCLADEPTAMVVDLGGLRLGGDPALVDVFASVAAQATQWPGSAVVLAGTSPEITALLNRLPAPRHLQLRADVSDALALAGERSTVRRVAEELEPARGTPAHARDLATEACLRWDLPDLIPQASVITTELVTNAVQHAGGRSLLSFSLGARYLHIGVRDASNAPPVPQRPALLALSGRGLLIVQSMATNWGHLPCPPGKVVWANLRVD